MGPLINKWRSLKGGTFATLWKDTTCSTHTVASNRGKTQEGGNDFQMSPCHTSLPFTPNKIHSDNFIVNTDIPTPFNWYNHPIYACKMDNICIHTKNIPSTQTECLTHSDSWEIRHKRMTGKSRLLLLMKCTFIIFKSRGTWTLHISIQFNSIQLPRKATNPEVIKESFRHQQDWKYPHIAKSRKFAEISLFWTKRERDSHWLSMPIKVKFCKLPSQEKQRNRKSNNGNNHDAIKH